MTQQILISSLSEIDNAAKEFLERIADTRLIAFRAPMGAGKTTFITAICKSMGIPADEISSPSFALVNEYRTPGGESVFHFDFYRIKDEREALDIGLYEYLDSGSYCFMEWPENVGELLPEETLQVQIEVLADGARRIFWEQ